MMDCPHIVGVCSQLPLECVAQPDITSALGAKWQGSNIQPKLVERFHRSSKVKQRHLALPLDEFFQAKNFAERNDAYIRVGLDISERAIRNLLDEYQISAQQINQIFFTTVTGLAIPSMDARLMNRIAFSPNLKRVPMFGLGCVAGAAGIARAADYLIGHPNDLVVLLALELCSLTFQENDTSVANAVSSGLFGDGCAAVLLAGGKRAQPNSFGPRVVDSCSFFFPDTERVMGFDVNDQGFKIVLSGDVPAIAKEKLPQCVDQMLGRHHLHRSDVAVWIAHPGGPKVLESLTDGLKLPPDALDISWESLEEVGNLSSASVLMVLQKTLERRQFRTGDYGVLLAMGPAFCAEVVLLRW